MGNAKHILEWCLNSGEHYKRLYDVHRRGQPDAPDCFLGRTGNAAGYFNLASWVYRTMCKANDVVEPYSATDILQAAVLMSQWEPQQ